MGCDIHSYCEIKKNGNNKWECVGRIFENPWINEDRIPTISDYEKGDNAYGENLIMHPYDMRDYDLFGILAGVRNGTWGDEIEPISEPKGLPEDVSKYVKKQSDYWDSDGHSHSWLTLEEIESFDWEKEVKKSAMVSEETKKEYELTGKKPTAYWAAGTGVPLEWTEKIKDNHRFFFEKTIPKLRELRKFGEVRIVFWFDN